LAFSTVLMMADLTAQSLVVSMAALTDDWMVYEMDV
jgi:hypothetical protein